MKAKAWRLGFVAGAIAAAMTLGLASCGDDDNNGGGAAAPPQVEPDRMALEIQSATVPDPLAAGTAARPTVRFRVLDPSGNPVNLEAEMATTTSLPNTTGPRFTLAMLDDDGNYRSYYESTAQPKDYTFEGTKPAPAPRTQATSPAVTKADFKNLGGGVYEYTFPAPTVTTGLDRTKTHTVGGWISRNLANGNTDSTGNALDFVPSGSGAVQHEQVVSNGACNRCHGQLTAHGSRRNVQLCITCHSPQTGDPETNRTVDFKVMIHKIHSGSTLPSVRRGDHYFIVGFRQAVVDWSDLTFPWHDHGVQHCTVCHAGGEDSANWKTRPSLAACTSCHDNVLFANAAGLDPCPTGTAAVTNTKDCLHTGGPIGVTNPASTNACVGCHGPGTANAVEKYHHGD